MSNPIRATTVAIVGAGEMGAAVAVRLREAGARALTTLRGRSAKSVERTSRARVEVVEDEDRLVSAAALILSIVPPGQATAVAERFRAPLTRAADKPVFADCNAVSPPTVRRIAELLSPSGCHFVDAGIIGGPPPSGRLDQGPRYYCSGPRADLMIALSNYGLDIRVVNDQIGAASALKMSYAGLTKGLIAVGAAMVGGASRAGLASELRAELERSQPELLAMLRMRMPAMFSKAYRWVAEMEQIGEFLGDAPNGTEIFTGAARLYEQVAAEWEKGPKASPSLAAIGSFVGK